MEELGGIINIDVLPQNDIELYYIPGCYTSSTVNMNDQKNVGMCRFCFSGDEMCSELGDWITPCKCSGSMKYVHRGCFNTWMNYANTNQRYQCRTCGFAYIRIWKIKSPINWTLPKLNLSCFDVVNILTDFYVTAHLYGGFCRVLEGKRSLVLQGICAILYKNLFLTRRRRIW